MDVAQLQDLADAAPKLLAAGAGHGLRFHLGVSLNADSPAAERTAVDGLLEEVVSGLKSGSKQSQAPRTDKSRLPEPPRSVLRMRRSSFNGG